MPGTIEQQVSAAIERHRADLVDLVRRLINDQLDAEIDRLVNAELAARATGAANGSSASEPETQTDVALKRCRICGRDLPASSFGKHRGACRSCLAGQQRVRARERRERERSQAGDDDAGGPRSSTAA